MKVYTSIIQFVFQLDKILISGAINPAEYVTLKTFFDQYRTKEKNFDKVVSAIKGTQEGISEVTKTLSEKLDEEGSDKESIQKEFNEEVKKREESLLKTIEEIDLDKELTQVLYSGFCNSFDKDRVAISTLVRESAELIEEKKEETK